MARPVAAASWGMRGAHRKLKQAIRSLRAQRRLKGSLRSLKPHRAEGIVGGNLVGAKQQTWHSRNSGAAASRQNMHHRAI